MKQEIKNMISVYVRSETSKAVRFLAATVHQQDQNFTGRPRYLDNRYDTFMCNIDKIEHRLGKDIFLGANQQFSVRSTSFVLSKKANKSSALSSNAGEAGGSVISYP